MKSLALFLRTCPRHGPHWHYPLAKDENGLYTFAYPAEYQVREMNLESGF